MFFVRTRPPYNSARPGIDIIRTRQVATSIQAVSPLFGTGAGGAAAAAAVWASAGSARSASASPPRPAARNVRSLMGSNLKGVLVLVRSERVGIGLAGADADGALERHDEDLAVADLAGPGRSGDRLDDAGDEVARDRDLDLELRQEAHGVFGAAVDLGMPLLPAVALHFRDGQPVHAEAGQRVAHLLELERLDDGHDDLHGSEPP